MVMVVSIVSLFVYAPIPLLCVDWFMHLYVWLVIALD